MEEEGIVSLWIGDAASQEALERALLAEFSDDGDYLGSAFSRAFGIEYYEDATREAEHHGGSQLGLRELLYGVSCEERVLPRFEQLGSRARIQGNCVVLLFNFRYSGERSSWRSESLELHLVGSVSYR